MVAVFAVNYSFENIIIANTKSTVVVVCPQKLLPAAAAFNSSIYQACILACFISCVTFRIKHTVRSPSNRQSVTIYCFFVLLHEIDNEIQPFEAHQRPS